MYTVSRDHILIGITLITMFSGVGQVDLPSPAIMAIVGLLDRLKVDLYQFIYH